MANLIRAHDNQNKAIVDASHPILSRCYFNLIHLKAGETYTDSIRGVETCWVVLQGTCDITVGEENFASVGQRKDIWSGQADSVYAPSGATVSVKAGSDHVEIAVAGSVCSDVHEAYRIKPEEVRMVEVGSVETHSRRCIYHILGSKDKGRTGNLLVSELYADPGCWSGYPPHKHDTDRPKDAGFEETGFEEIYHYRFAPETGFGAQFNFFDDGSGGVSRTQHKDTFLVERGYHPTVTSPGHACYIFTILVGHTQHSLVQYFEEKHRHLSAKIPGVQAMVDLFTGASK